MHYKLTDSGNVISTGTLAPAVTKHGHLLRESKLYFNGQVNYDKPTVTFFVEGEEYTVEAKPTKTGFSGHLVKHGNKYGINFNRVRNTRARWGLTVWCEELESFKQGA
jgi:hypothetical protein